ncbi:MAG: hypothetical protein JJU12_04940 [Chlamydiales bacterium]|nr:hypothetical protein [Chlamydiales bacterium]
MALKIQSRKMIRFNSLMTHMSNEQGHYYDYNICFRNTIKTLGIAYKGYVNKKCSIESLPGDWERSLNWKDQKGAFKKIYQLFKHTLCFSRIFRKKILPHETRIFFIESLKMTDFAALALSLFLFSKKNDNLWLLLHQELANNFLKQKIYHVCFRLIQRKLSKNFVLLAFTERIGLFFEERLKQEVHIIPLPHTDPSKKIKKKVSNFKTIWWPGAPRHEKGLLSVLSLAEGLANISDQISNKPHNLPPHHDIGKEHYAQRSSEKCGVATEDIQLCLSEAIKPMLTCDSSNIRFLKPILSREEYLYQLEISDAILLPYEAKSYYYRISGIFVEAVFAGKFPLVAEGSWLAYELRKYDLTELILDWKQPNLPVTILQLLDDVRPPIFETQNCA